MMDKIDDNDVNTVINNRNKIKYKHKDINKKISYVLQTTWRPAVGWVGLSSLIYAGIVHNMMLWIWTILQVYDVIPIDHQPPSNTDAEILYAIIGATLGIAGMRSYDKSRGINSRRMY